MLILTSSTNFTTKKWATQMPKKPQEMRLTFIPTAAEVEEGDLSWLHDDRQSLVDAGFKVTDFTLTGKTEAEVQAMLDQTDIVFVSGGNTFFLLQQMQQSGFTTLIHDYVKKGVIYVGSSAGSVVAGPDISFIELLDDRSLAPNLNGTKGLGLLDVVVFPHWGSEHFHDRYEKLIKSCYARGQKIILLTDDQYLLVEGERYRIESVTLEA